MADNDISRQNPDKQTKPSQPFSGADSQSLGEFEVKKEIGRGGTSIVYEAYQPSLKRVVALKVLRRPLIKEPSLIERFHREAEAAANLHHPNIVPIYAMGKKGDLDFFAMEKIEGNTLDEILESGEGLSIGKTYRIIRSVAKAASYAHTQGIVHRDIKPSNIMIDKIGRILVTDFGLAKSIKWNKVTSSQTVLGTPVYMSPEQAQGEETDARTDIYSLGVVLYEMVCKGVPFYAEEPIAILRKVIEKDAEEPRSINSDIPKDLETIILKCLEKNPAKRYQTMGLFLRDIELCQKNLPLLTRRSEITIFAKKRREYLIKAAGVLLLTMVISSAIIFVMGRRGSFDGFIRRLTAAIPTYERRKAVNVKSEKPASTGWPKDELPVPLAEELADIIYLKNGRKIIGIIEEASDKKVIIRLRIGTATYPRRDISSIEYSTPKKREKLMKFWGGDDRG